MAGTAVDNRDEGVAGPRAVWRIVRRRDFGPYFLGNALSASGTWFQNLAAALLIYRLTHSALLLGVLNFSQFIPILVLTPWAGASPTGSTAASFCSSPRASPPCWRPRSRRWRGEASRQRGS